ncbi:MAG: helix-turn-helix domain-containing protein [Pseudomonadota bacterium]
MQYNSERLGHSIKESSDKLGVTPRTIYNLLYEGKLESFKVGRSRRVTDESLRRLAQNIDTSLSAA